MSDIRRHSLFLVLAACVLLSINAVGKQPAPASDSVESNLPQPEWVKLYGREQGIAEPVLIQPATSLQSDCKGQKRDGRVKLSFVVDSNGFPRNLVFERALANEVDLLALKLILNTRFHPATLNGSPVAIGSSVDMHLQACAEETKDQSGKASGVLRLRYPAEEKFEDWRDPPAQANLAPIAMPPGMQAERKPVNNHFTPPKLLNQPDTPDGKGRSGTFSFVVVVDEHGIPQVRETLTSTDQTLLPQVIQCIRNTRYQPALNDGMPVPARITLGLNIRSLVQGPS
jgi:hypothetical protein